MRTAERSLRRPAPWHTVAAAIVVAGLAACGGGSDDPAPTAPVDPGPGPTCGLPRFEAEMLQRVNAVRAAGARCGARGTFAPTAPLQWHGVLVSAAAGHSRDMAEHNFFSHTGSDNRSASQRISSVGYGFSIAAENIAAGYRTVQDVMDGWMSSDGHCANIMHPALRDVGVACVPGGDDNTYSNYWTMNLAAP